MAYIVSPYAGAAEFPSDNMPAQLLQQGLQAGYARRMKEMEQKMKLQEEGKKAFDESYKYANLDLSKVDPIYQNELKNKASSLAKTMVEAYKQNPATFKNNTDIAEMARKLQEEKSQYENLSTFIKSEREAKKQFEKEGKIDVTSTEFGNLYEEYVNPTTAPERKSEIEAIWQTKFTGGNLYTTKERVAPYTPLEEFGKAIKDTVKASDEKGDVTEEQYLAGKDITRQKLNENPNNIPYYAKFYNVTIDPQNPKKAEDELVEIINEKQNPLNIKRDEPRVGFGLTFDGNSVSNKKTILTSVTSEKENKEDLTNQFYNQYVNNYIEMQPDFKERKKEASNTGGVYTVENYRNDGSLKKLEQNYPKLFQTYKERAKAIADKNERENVTTHFFSTIAPTSNPIDIYLDKKQTLYGRPISFTTDKNGVITNIQYIQDEKAGGITIPKGKTTPITAYNWTLIRDSYGLGDLIKAKEIKLPKDIEDALKSKSTTSAPKESESKETNESKKKPTLSDALKAFEEKFKRKPSETELNKLKLKYK